jgi:hypothetical protein
MTDLFANDPVFKRQQRDHKGRFATKEKSLYDKVIRERNYMEYQVEKYRRMADSCSKTVITQFRMIEDQKRIIANLRKALAETQQNTQKC